MRIFLIGPKRETKQIRTELGQQKGWKYIGESSDLDEAYLAIRREKPDVILYDAAMQGSQACGVMTLLQIQLPNIEWLAYEMPLQQQLLREKLEKFVQAQVRRQQQAQRELQEMLQRLLCSTEPITEIAKGNQQFSFLFSYQWFDFILYEYKGNLLRTSNQEQKKRKQQLLQVQQRLKQQQQESSGLLCFALPFYQTGLLFYAKEKADLEGNIQQQLKKIEQQCPNTEGICVGIGVGQVTNSFFELAQCYESAEEAFYYAQVMLQQTKQKQEIVFYEQLQGAFKQEASFFSEEKIELETFLQKGTRSEIPGFVEQYLSEMQERGIQSFLFRQYKWMDFYIKLIQFIKQLPLQKVPEALEQQNISVTRFASLDLMESRKILINWLELALSAREAVVTKKYERLLEKSKQYVKEHFRDQTIGLKQVADYVGLSPTYFSNLFRKETGKTFISYLIHLRMQEAKMMLRCTNFKIVAISMAVGYQDPQYFSALFKKTQGCTPKQYRLGSDSAKMKKHAEKIQERGEDDARGNIRIIGDA